MDQRPFDGELVQLKKHFDPIIERARSSAINNHQESCIPSLLLAPWKEMKALIDLLKEKSWQFLPITITTPMFLAMGTLTDVSFIADWKIPLIENKHNLVNWGFDILLFLLWYIITCGWHLIKMTQLDSETFHMDAYKRFRKAEYKAFIESFIQPGNNFSFEALGQWVQRHADQNIAQEFLRRMDEWKEREKILIDSMNQMRVVGDDTINEKDQIIEEMNQQADYLRKVIRKMTDNLYRLINGSFTKHDLNLIGPFSLYRQDGDRLVKIADGGTSGISAAIIPLGDPKFKDYACVLVLQVEDDTLYNNPRQQEKTILAYRMGMENGQTWVYNFHIDTSDQMAMELCFGDGIIGSRNILRMVHLNCLLYQKFIQRGEYFHVDHEAIK